MNLLIKIVRDSFVLLIIVFISSFCNFLEASPVSANKDSVIVSSKLVVESIYKGECRLHGSFYRKMWGEHYSPLYYTPIEVESVRLGSIYGGLHTPRQAPYLYGILLESNHSQFYLLKLLGGITSFSESKFFQNIYNPRVFANTYVGNFIKEAYTIQHPYGFMASDYLAKETGLYSGNPAIYSVLDAKKDTVADGAGINNRLVSIYQLPDLDSKNVITDIDQLLEKLHTDDFSKIDKHQYIRARLFDMLIGDWNKIPENWNWVSHQQGDTTVFEPVVLDRSYAFTKADGIAFRQLINMLGLNFIVTYKDEIKDLKNLNKLGYALDMALTNDCDEAIWVEEARFLKDKITDDLIDEAFRTMPSEVQDSISASIKQKLKSRKSNLDITAIDYYRLLQKTPVIAGSHKDQSFVIDRLNSRELNIRIYDAKQDSLIFNRTYNSKDTKEIWIYSLDGHDSFEVKGKSDKGVPIALIGGKGINNYKIERKGNLTIYEGKEQRNYQDSTSSLPKAKIIVPSDESALDYDYQKLRYTKFSVTPIGVYDSDLGLNLGTSISYTTYGFRRAPFSSQHQLSFDYNSGFIYQGIFPDFDAKKSFHLSAFLGSSAYFSNFFGFGNDTDGYKDEKKNYNRVNLKKYAITPGFYYTINKDQELNLSTSFDIYKINDSEKGDRLINKMYPEGNSIYDAKYYMDVNAAYVVNKKLSDFFSNFSFSLNPGWVINFGDPKKNYAYIKSSLGVNLKLTDRLTFATLVKGTALSTNKYEFYQAATTELRGFRNNRFIGKRSLYQYSDLRFDMGRIRNPFTPLGYGLFVGVDYGRVWYPEEDSKDWHTSYGGGFWLTLFNKFTGNFSYFASKDTGRFSFGLGFKF